MKPLKQIREEKGYSVQDLADKIGVTRQTVYNYEKEGFASATLGNMMKLFEVLEIELKDIDVNYKEEK